MKSGWVWGFEPFLIDILKRTLFIFIIKRNKEKIGNNEEDSF